MTNPFSFGAILDMVLSLFVGLNVLLTKFLATIGDGLNWVLSLEITELTVVGHAWSLIRDVCNLVFIVVFIGIAFGTIFNATGFFKGWHYRTALAPLIIAALLMNFSLAIGKTVTLASNEATKIVLSVMKSPGTLLVQAMKPNGVALGVDMNALNALRSPIVDTTQTLTDAEQTRLERCLKEEKTIVDTDENAFYYAVRHWTGYGIGDTTVGKSLADCNLEINDARYGTTPQTVAAAGQQVVAAKSGTPVGNTTDEKFALISNEIFKAIIVIMLISCLLTAFIFLGLRIIVVWALLAISPVAFASFGIPGSHKGWDKWKQHLIAWNVFGPLYLLTLIPGLVMLGGSGEITQRLLAAGGNIGTANMLIQQFFFYAFAVLIFVGGLTLSLGSSFAATVKGTEVVGGWASSLGVFDGKGLAPLRYIGETTGISAAARGAGGALADKYIKPFRGVGVDQERVEARFRQLTTGDKAAMEKLQLAKISEQIKKNKEANVSTAELRRHFAAGPKSGPKYFAAAQALTEAGELNDAEMNSYVIAATTVSPKFGERAREITQRQIKGKLKEKKFKSVDEATEAMSSLTQKDREATIRAIKNTQPLLYAKMAQAGHVIEGGKKLSTSEALETVATKLSDEEWVEAYKEGLPLGEKAQYNFNAKLRSKDAYKLLGSADKETREKLEGEIIKLGGPQQSGQPAQSRQSRPSGPSESERNQAAQAAADMAGGISDERREEIRRDMEALNRNNQSTT